MATQLKSAAPTPAGTTSPEVIATVSGIIADIRQRGDAAVREYSERFDRWSPPLVPTRRRRRRAHHRHRAGGHDRRHRDGAGERAPLRPGPARLARRLRDRDGSRGSPRPEAPADLGHRRLRARWALSAHRVGAHDDRHRQGRRGAARRRVHTADPWRDPGRHRRRHAPRRRRRDLPPRGRAGRRRPGARHRDHRAGQPASPGPATPTSPRRSVSSSARSASTCSPDRPRSW